MASNEYTVLPSMLEEDEPEARELYPGNRESTGFDPEHGSSHVPYTLREKTTDASHVRIQNLDAWCSSLYQYFEGKGFWCIVFSRVLNVLTLAFTVFFSGFLLLYVDWRALGGECAEASLRSQGKEHSGHDNETQKDMCNILRDAVFSDPLRHRSFMTNAVVCSYLLLFSVYLGLSLLKLITDIPNLQKTRIFCNKKLGVSDDEMQTISWPEIVARVVHIQNTGVDICIVKHLNEHDIVARILRKENYVLGMLNRDVLGLSFGGASNGARNSNSIASKITSKIPFINPNHVWFTKTVEWNIVNAITSNMFDDDFGVKHSFYDATALKNRFRFLAVVNLILSPFVAIFITVYFFLTHVERFYHDPGSAGLRQWSTYSKWKLREFNELEHFLEERIKAAHRPATRYIAQFGSPLVSLLAKFVSYLVGAFVAFALACTLLLDDRLLHAEIFGRDLLWHTAVMGAVLAASRGLITEENKAFEPNLWMACMVQHTHYLPKRWRSVAHKKTTATEFSQMFKFKSAIFLEELLSVFLAPFLLWGPLSDSAPDIIQFVRQFSENKPGIGCVCSLSTFDFQKHGNAKYGAPVTSRKNNRSRQGKMEKSFVSFTSRYPTWEPDSGGKEMLQGLVEFREREGVEGMEASMGQQSASLSWAPNPEDGRFPSPGSGSVFGLGSSLGRVSGYGGTTDDAQTDTHKIGFFGHGRVAGTVAGTGDIAGAAEERLDAETQVLLQRMYESRAGAVGGVQSDVQSIPTDINIFTPVSPPLSTPIQAMQRSLPIRSSSLTKKPIETEMTGSVSVSMSPPTFAPPPRAPAPVFSAPPNLWELESEEKKNMG